LYTGTPALKTDFTRTGKRTYLGALNDGKHSVIRYYINNFCDGFNHDCLDISQKKLTPTSNLQPRSIFTKFKLSALSLLGVLYLTQLFLASQFPYPAETAEATPENDYLAWKT